MLTLIERLRRAAVEDSDTIFYEVASAETVRLAEEFLGFELPELLKRCYIEISNGGFGPARMIGVNDGHHSGLGDLLTSWHDWQKDDKFEQGWLPIFDYGCANMQMVDCTDHSMITFYEGDFYQEGYSFEKLLRRWADGRYPILSTGDFSR